MVRPKQQQQKKKKKKKNNNKGGGGVDFAKIKRKIGRKLPPAKNATDTTVKSKALVLPEQSVASDKAGLAVSGKGLTLKELLHQTSHHNAKVRREAVNGVRDLVLKHPSELKLHWLLVLHKLRERIGDDDKTVREALYHLLKSAIFTAFEDDVPTPLVSLLMASVLNAMTHLAFDVRMMAFRFFDLIVERYPSSFFLYAEQVLHHYHDILRNVHVYFNDKGKLEVALTGLVRCLSLLASGPRSSCMAPVEEPVTLHAFDCDPPPMENPGDSRIIPGRVESLIPTLISCFQETASSVRAMNNVEDNLYSCMLKTLESLKLAVKVYAGRRGELSGSSRSSPFPIEGTIASMRCQNSLPYILVKLFDMFPLGHFSKSFTKLSQKEELRYVALNVGITEVYLYFDELFGDPLAFIDNRFLIYVREYLSNKVFHSAKVDKEVREKIASLLLSVPKVVMKVDSESRRGLLLSFTDAFQRIKVETMLILKFLSVMEAMLVPSEGQELWLFEKFRGELYEFQIIWTQKLCELLLNLGNEHPSVLKAVLHLLLRLGQSSSGNFLLSDDSVQRNFCLFYNSNGDDDTCSSTFVKLPRDCQELAICCLYYFSNLDCTLLRSLVACCLYKDLDLHILCRIVEVVHSTFRAGRVHMEDHVSFLITMLIKFRVLPESNHLLKDEYSIISNRSNYNALTNMVCSRLSEIGDCLVVLKLVHKIVFHSTCPWSQLDNARGILKMFVLLDPSPTEPSEEILSALSYYMWSYLIHAASFVPENNMEPRCSKLLRIFYFYFQPALILLRRWKKLLGLLLDVMMSSIKEFVSFPACDSGEESFTEQLNRIEGMISIIRFLHEDTKIVQSLPIFRAVINDFLQTAKDLLSRKDFHTNLFKSLKIKNSLDHLITQTGGVHFWNANDFVKISNVS